MYLFKIYGERNSGTTYLERLLRINNFPVYVHTELDGVNSFWKHGVPRTEAKNRKNIPEHLPELTNKINEPVTVIDIFIFRNLEDWLISTFKQPYHLIRMHNFSDFLTLPQHSAETKLVDFQTKECLNADDNGKTIFEIRSFKFQAIMKYASAQDNIIFLNMTYLQNNTLEFLNMLNNDFTKMPHPKFIVELEHTKVPGEIIKNRSYDVNIADYANIIDNYSDNEIESFIRNLTVEYHETPTPKVDVL